MTAAFEAHLQGIAVLVVEDDDDSRELFVHVLEACGASVTAAASAREALEAFRSSRIRVVVSDITMPGEDGYWLASRLRELAADGGVALLAVTAHSREHGRERALSAGFHQYLRKPLDPHTLCRTVENLVAASA